MPDLEQIAKSMLGEMERVLDTKKVVGEPITAGDSTIIPLVSLGLAFGGGVGEGNAPGQQESQAQGSGSGAGVGGGVKPVAVVVITKDGVRLEPLKRGATPVLERVVDTIGKAAERHSKESKKKEE